MLQSKIYYEMTEDSTALLCICLWQNYLDEKSRALTCVNFGPGKTLISFVVSERRQGLLENKITTTVWLQGIFLFTDRCTKRLHARKFIHITHYYFHWNRPSVILRRILPSGPLSQGFCNSARCLQLSLVNRWTIFTALTFCLVNSSAHSPLSWSADHDNKQMSLKSKINLVLKMQ